MNDSQISLLAKQTISEFDSDNDLCLSMTEFKRAMFDSDIEEILTLRLL